MTLAAGTKLGPYDVLLLVGAGGMGDVYRAKDTRLGSEVANKVLPEEFFEDEERGLRFEREARTLARTGRRATTTCERQSESEKGGLRTV